MDANANGSNDDFESNQCNDNRELASEAVIFAATREVAMQIQVQARKSSHLTEANCAMHGDWKEEETQLRDLNDDLDDYMQQDDGDAKLRTKHVLTELKTVFRQRIDPKHQVNKMADVWRIENVYGECQEKNLLKNDGIHSLQTGGCD